MVSREFDPILELAGGAKEDKALLEVDDRGNESRFATRLPETGKYEIRIRAFKYQGSTATGSLCALKLPKTGRYTVWISARRGAGEYTARLIDGD